MGTGVVALPAAAHAANVALEAPAGAIVTQPGEVFGVVQALLEERGHTVTIVSGDQIDTLDEIQQFDTVVLSGSGYQDGQDVAVFDGVLVDYVSQGGGLVIAGWVYYYYDEVREGAPGFNTVAPFEASESFVFGGVVEIIPGHEIVDGLSDWNNPDNDAYSGAIKPGATALSSNGGLIDAGVWEYEGGRVASFGPLFTSEYEVYPGTPALHDGSIPDATEMFLRGIEWTATQAAPVGCHDGDLDEGEQCDDGNFSNSDDCVNPCVFASCGDHYVHAGFEPCDDGDDDNTDACLVGCILASCGDGFVRVGVEDCDDGENGVETDACVSGCVAASCGDGHLYAGVETCDDGNLDDSDDCPGSCQPAVCGDGYVLAGVEPCDDGNDVNDDDCLVGCIAPTCGDGYLQNGTEACDDANDDDTDACVGAVCQLASCGDGFIFAGFEECDDGNQTPGDGCTACALDGSESSSEGGGESSSEGGGESSSEGGAEGTSGATEESGGATAADTTGVDPSTTGVDTLDSSGGDDPSSTGSDSTGDGAIDGSSGGCGCHTRSPGASDAWWLVVLGAARRRSRRAASSKFASRQGS